MELNIKKNLKNLRVAKYKHNFDFAISFSHKWIYIYYSIETPPKNYLHFPFPGDN